MPLALFDSRSGEEFVIFGGNGPELKRAAQRVARYAVSIMLYKSINQIDDEKGHHFNCLTTTAIALDLSFGVVYNGLALIQGPVLDA